MVLRWGFHMNYVFTCLVALLCFQLPLSAWVCAYTRLFKPDTETTVDILYDNHQKRNTLFPTEERLEQILEHLNQAGEQIDIVWEAYHA